MQSIRGVNDFFGDESDRFNEVISRASLVANNYNFSYLSTPILEYSHLFERNLGSDTDVVAKEIYKFTDKSGDEIALRPEFTAGIVRAFCENPKLKSAKLPLKLFSHGPLFRYERPQSGRYRQFHQINYEIFGANGVEYDCLILLLARDVIDALRVENYTCELNFIGGLEVKNQYISYLNEYFSKYSSELSEDSRNRLAKGKSLRILDSKDENDKKIAANARGIENFYSKETAQNIEKIVQFLEDFGVKYSINRSIVRGLDYYTDMVFEFMCADLASKSQKTLLGGGRYDSLVRDISGGKMDISAVGFAGGVERLMQISNFSGAKSAKIAITFVTENEISHAFKVHNAICKMPEFSGVKCDLIFGYSSVSKRIKKASDIGCDYLVVIGAEEVASGVCKIRSLGNNLELDGKIVHL